MTLKTLEQRLRALLEGQLAGRVAGAVHPLEVVRALARELVATEHLGMASDDYTVYFHPGQERVIVALGSAFEDELRLYLATEAKGRDIRFPAHARFRFAPLATVPSGQLRTASTAPTTVNDAPTLAAPTLQIIEGFGLGKSHSLGTRNCRLGRDADCDILVTDPGVSHHHAQITYENKAFWLEDLGSRYGTQLNGLPVRERTPLAAGDLIKIGHTLMRFVNAVSK